MFVHTVHLLLHLTDIHHLPVADLLERLLETEGGRSQPSSLSGNRHVLCWGFEDALSSHEKQATSSSTVNATNNTNNSPGPGRNISNNDAGQSSSDRGNLLSR